MPVNTIFLLLLPFIVNTGCFSDSGSDGAYRDIVYAEDRLFLAGTSGRIVYYEAAGNAASLNNSFPDNINSILVYDSLIFAAGDNGTLLFAEDGDKFTRLVTGSSVDINEITIFKDLLVAGADNGSILVSSDGKTCGAMNTGAEGNILSISANKSFCIGVTDKGEIIKSTDGFNWQVTRFNKEYAGYYRPCVFRKVLVTENRIVIAGQYDDGSPAVMLSSLGSVWTERILNYETDNGEYRMLICQINDIAYDIAGDQFILACDNGEIMFLPSCTKCNMLRIVSDKDINGIALSGEWMFLAGEDYSFVKSRIR